MKIITAVLLFLSLVFLVVAKPQEKPAPVKYEPNEVQMLRLQSRIKDAQIGQREIIIAQQRFEFLKELAMLEADKIRVENGWPDTVKFDLEHETWSDSKKEEPKK
jgi:hypothetical protein